MKGRLEHAVSSLSLPGWKSMEEIESAVEIDMGEYVIYNDWVGQVRSRNTDMCRTRPFILCVFAGRRGPFLLLGTRPRCVMLTA